MELVDAYGEKETYMSPVMHTTKDGSMYILYGSGGETVRGKLWTVIKEKSWLNLYETFYVENTICEMPMLYGSGGETVRVKFVDLFQKKKIFG